MVDKVIRNGKVAVLYSPGFGAKWSAWVEKHQEIMLFHPRLVEAVEKGENSESQMEKILQDLLGKHDIYTGGAEQLKIKWINQGTRFFIDEYDGHESVIIIDPDFGFVA